LNGLAARFKIGLTIKKLKLKKAGAKVIENGRRASNEKHR
tara:strand:- start:32 stop:151 length:120 start_codon:yes stop_codon:yes gene_type:complete